MEIRNAKRPVAHSQDEKWTPDIQAQEMGDLSIVANLNSAEDLVFSSFSSSLSRENENISVKFAVVLFPGFFFPSPSCFLKPSGPAPSQGFNKIGEPFTNLVLVD